MGCCRSRAGPPAVGYSITPASKKSVLVFVRSIISLIHRQRLSVPGAQRRQPDLPAPAVGGGGGGEVPVPLALVGVDRRRQAVDRAVVRSSPHARLPRVLARRPHPGSNGCAAAAVGRAGAGPDRGRLRRRAPHQHPPAAGGRRIAIIRPCGAVRRDVRRGTALRLVRATGGRSRRRRGLRRVAAQRASRPGAAGHRRGQARAGRKGVLPQRDRGPRGDAGRAECW